MKEAIERLTGRASDEVLIEQTRVRIDAKKKAEIKKQVIAGDFVYVHSEGDISSIKL